MRILVPALVTLLVAGCATSATTTPSPRYLQGALEEITSTSVSQLRVEDVRLMTEGPVVVGPPGHALNVASSLHRVFEALGIPSEIRCAPISELEDRRQIQIRFPSDLSESQREDVRLLLGLIRDQVATL